MKQIKRFCVFALFILLLAAAAITAGAQETEQELYRADTDQYCSLRGDTDGDGKVTASDARTILRCAARLEIIDHTRDGAYELDGVFGVSASDARLALRVSVGLDSRPSHVEAESLQLQQATCYEPGITAKKCVYCNCLYNFGAISQKPHTGLGWETKKPATCTEKGLKEEYCMYCGILIASEDIPCIPHYYGPIRFVSDTPDCTKAQPIYQECEMCGKRVTGIRVATAHDFQWKVTQPPTCTAQGKQEYVCKVCGVSSGDTAVVASLGGHIPSGWITIVNSTYAHEGLRRIVCQRCSEVLEEEVIPKREY